MKIFSIITLCLLVCVAFSYADLMDGLVLYMPLDEGSGSTTKDFSANGFEGEVMGNASGFKDINDNETELETGKWYYLAYTHTDDNNGLVVIYLDGAETHSEESGNPVAPAQNTSAVTIGTWGGEAWTGSVDEVRLWNRALSADEIKASMNQDAASFLTPVEPEGKLATSWVNIKLTR
ncbi:LamG domain-containing protein [Candidatus Poribacteria bacterium]|nr:LamG domain-containing protein [Candidatus Poribacteria bacterium]MYK21078.1 LamG domain-containing protein [Candidatus Poribacteria bacterium]